MNIWNQRFLCLLVGLLVVEALNRVWSEMCIPTRIGNPRLRHSFVYASHRWSSFVDASAWGLSSSLCSLFPSSLPSFSSPIGSRPSLISVFLHLYTIYAYYTSSQQVYMFLLIHSAFLQFLVAGRKQFVQDLSNIVCISSLLLIYSFSFKLNFCLVAQKMKLWNFVIF